MQFHLLKGVKMFKLVNNGKNPLKKDLFITVAGNVGAGKSTLTTLVGEAL